MCMNIVIYMPAVLAKGYQLNNERNKLRFREHHVNIIWFNIKKQETYQWEFFCLGTPTTTNFYK